jgi:hypothetical protein
VTTFREIVATETATAEELPLVHTTRCQEFREVLASDELRACEECKVFGGHILYFFYGRPAYRTKGGGQPAGTVDVCPVCFVFKTGNWNSGLARLFPCDTGALKNRIFENHLFWADCGSLELNHTIESARKLVSLVFDTNGSYFLGKARPSAPASFASGTVAARYHALLVDTDPSKADDRRSAIEIQVGSPVALSNRLRYVVLPNDVLNESGVLTAIQTKWGADALGYDLYHGRQPNDYRSTISDKVKDELRKGGLL